MDDNKEITLTIVQLSKLLKLTSIEKVKFWIYLKKDLSISDIIEKLEVAKNHQK